MSDILGSGAFTGWVTSTSSKDILGVVTSDNSYEATFCNPGLYTWTVPNGVRYISGVIVGGGAGGNTTNLGGTGGELTYFNNLDLGASASGTTIKVYVGNGGTASSTTTAWGEPSVIFDKSVAVTNANYSVITPGVVNTSGGSWTPNINTSFSYSAMVIGGGGGGGNGSGGSGGGGGGSAYINNFYPFNKVGPYTVITGGGGSANSAGNESNITASDNTILLKATGGGAGSKVATGGSGGIGSITTPYGANGSGTGTGGTGGGSTTSNAGAGGGGAAGANANGGAGGVSVNGGNGGSGTAATTNTGAGGGGGGGSAYIGTNYYAGGGGGGNGSIALFSGTGSSSGGLGGTYNSAGVPGQQGKAGGVSGSAGGTGAAGGAYGTGNSTYNNGYGGNGGAYGGGGGGGFGISTTLFSGGNGGAGNVTIVYPGVTRTFPSNNLATYTTNTYWITVNSASSLPLVLGMPIYFDQAVGPLTANTVYIVTSVPANYTNATSFWYFSIADFKNTTTNLPASTGVTTASVNIFYPSNVARGGGSTLTFTTNIKSAGATSFSGGTTTIAGGGGAAGYSGAGGNGGSGSNGGGGGGGNSTTNNNGAGGVGLYGAGLNGTVQGGGSYGRNGSGNNGGLFGGGGGYTGNGANGGVRIVWGGAQYASSALPQNSKINLNKVTSSALPSGTLITATKDPNYSTVTVSSNPTSTGLQNFNILGAFISNGQTSAIDTQFTNRYNTSTTQPTNYAMPHRIDNNNNFSQELSQTTATMPSNYAMPHRIDNNNNPSLELSLNIPPKPNNLDLVSVSKNQSTDESVINNPKWG